MFKFVIQEGNVVMRLKEMSINVNLVRLQTDVGTTVKLLVLRFRLVREVKPVRSI